MKPIEKPLAPPAHPRAATGALPPGTTLRVDRLSVTLRGVSAAEGAALAARLPGALHGVLAGEAVSGSGMDARLAQGIAQALRDAMGRKEQP